MVRHDDWQIFDVRSLSYNPDVNAANPQENEISLLDLGSTLRDSQSERDWIVNLMVTQSSRLADRTKQHLKSRLIDKDEEGYLPIFSSAPDTH